MPSEPPSRSRTRRGRPPAGSASSLCAASWRRFRRFSSPRELLRVRREVRVRVDEAGEAGERAEGRARRRARARRRPGRTRVRRGSPEEDDPRVVHHSALGVPRLRAAHPVGSRPPPGAEPRPPARRRTTHRRRGAPPRSQERTATPASVVALGYGIGVERVVLVTAAREALRLVLPAGRARRRRPGPSSWPWPCRRGPCRRRGAWPSGSRRSAPRGREAARPREEVQGPAAGGATAATTGAAAEAEATGAELSPGRHEGPRGRSARAPAATP